MREFIPPIAGLSGMKYKAFLPLDAVGVFLWVVSFVLTGQFLGNQAEALLGNIQDTAVNLGLLFAIGYALVFGVRVLQQKRHGKAEPTTSIH